MTIFIAQPIPQRLAIHHIRHTQQIPLRHKTCRSFLRVLFWSTFVAYSPVQAESAVEITDDHATLNPDQPHSAMIRELHPDQPHSATIRGLTFPKGQMNLLVIKGSTIDITLAGRDSDQFDVTTTGIPSISKNKSILILKPTQKGQITGHIVIPHGTRVVIQGALLNVKLDRLIGDLDVRGGSVKIIGGGRLSKLSVRSGQAKLQVRGVMGQTDIDCGDGTIDLVYEKDNAEKIDALVVPSENPESPIQNAPDSAHVGLLLHQPAIRIKLHLAKGRVNFFFPPQSTVRYPKEIENIQSFIDYVAKHPAFNISPYLSTSAELFLRSSDDFEAYKKHHWPA